MSGNSARNSISDAHPKCDGPSTNEANKPVFLDEITSSTDDNAGKEEGMLENCGMIPMNCLPCIPSTVPSIEKRRPSSPPSARKKASLKLPFKWKEENVVGALRTFYSIQLDFHLISVQEK